MGHAVLCSRKFKRAGGRHSEGAVELMLGYTREQSVNGLLSLGYSKKQIAEIYERIDKKRAKEFRHSNYTYLGMQMAPYNRGLSSGIRDIADRYVQRFIPDDFEGEVFLSDATKSSVDRPMLGHVCSVVSKIIAHKIKGRGWYIHDNTFNHLGDDKWYWSEEQRQALFIDGRLLVFKRSSDSSVRQVIRHLYWEIQKTDRVLAQ